MRACKSMKTLFQRRYAALFDGVESSSAALVKAAAVRTIEDRAWPTDLLDDMTAADLQRLADLMILAANGMQDRTDEDISENMRVFRGDPEELWPLGAQATTSIVALAVRVVTKAVDPTSENDPFGRFACIEVARALATAGDLTSLIVRASMRERLGASRQEGCAGAGRDSAATGRRGSV